MTIYKRQSILSDVTKFKFKLKFKELKEDWFKCILRLEDKLNRFLGAVKRKLSDDVYS